MNVNAMRIVRNVLFAAVCIAFIVGLIICINTEKEKAHSLDNIDVELTKVTVLSNGDVDFGYKFTNGTKTNWSYLKIKTYIYGPDGIQIGTVTTEFGSQQSKEGGLKLEPGKNTQRVSTLHYENTRLCRELNDHPDAFTYFKFEHEILLGSYYDKK